MEYESTKGLVKRAVAQSKIIENKIIGKTGVMPKDLNKAKRTIRKIISTKSKLTYQLPFKIINMKCTIIREATGLFITAVLSLIVDF